MINIYIDDLIRCSFLVYILNKGFDNLDYKIKLTNIEKFGKAIVKGLKQNNINVILYFSPIAVENYFSRHNSEFLLTDDGFVVLSKRLNIIDFIENYPRTLNRLLLVEVNKRKNYKLLL